MALFGALSNALGGFGSFLGKVIGTVGQVGQLGQTVGLNLLPAVGPTVPTVLSQQPIQTAARMPGTLPPPMQQSLGGLVGGISRGITRLVAPVLVKIAEATGATTMTLRRAVKIVRRMGRVLPPASVAIALGLSLDELGQLILADSQRVRRRMNPANVSALRRSMRRIQSFHRLCQKADALRAPSRRRSSPKRIPATGTTIVQAR